MALTKVGPAGIGSTPGNGFTIGNSFLHATGLDSTNAKFTGIVTAQTFRVLGDFQVDGTTTTLDTAVTEVDRLEVGANNNTVAVAVTQSGSGDILNLYDGSTEVFTVTDGGNVGINVVPTNYSNYTTLALSDTTGSTIEGRVSGVLKGSLTVDSQVTLNSVAAIPLVFKTTNSERARITSGGNFGIKNTSPNNSLTVGDTVQPSYTPSSAGNYIEIARTSGADAGLLINKDTGQWLVGIDNSDGANAPLRFEYGAAGSAHPGFGSVTPAMIMKHDGKIGIGINNPLALLHLNQSSSTGYTTLNFSNSATDGRSIQVGFGGTATGSYQNKLYIYDNTASAVRGALDSSGNFGLGTLAPVKRLNVAESTGGNLFRLSGLNNYNLDISNTNANGAQFDFTIGSGGGAYTLNNSNGELLRVTGTGDVGINCTPHSNAGINLHIHGDNAASEIRLTNTTTGSGANGAVIQQSGNTFYISNTENGNTVFETNGSEKVRITSSGLVGIGDNNPDTKLTVKAGSGNQLRLDNAGERYTQISLRNSGSQKAAIWLDNTNNTFDLYGSTNIGIRMHTNGYERLRITSAGDVGIGEASPADRLVVQEANANGDVAVRIKNDTTTDGSASTPTTASLYLNTSTADFNTFYIQTRRTDNYTHFGYADPRASGHIPYMVLTNSRQTLIGGGTAPYSDYNGTNGGWNGGHFINGGGSTQWGTLHIADWDDDTTKDSYGGTNVFLSRCKSETIGDHSGGALAANNPIARLLFNGSDGSHFRNAAWIECKIDGTPGSNNMPGLLSFATSSGSGAAPVERLRITKDGRQYHYTDGSLRMHLNATGLGVNTDTITGGRIIHAHNTGTGSAYFQSTNSNTGEGASSGALFGMSGTTCYAPWNYTNGDIIMATNSSEKMRITSGGLIGINMTPGTDASSTYMLQMYNAGAQCFMSIGNGTSGNGPLNGLIIGNDASNAYIYNREATNLKLGTNNSDRLTITPSGSFLVGTSSDGSGRYAFYNPGSSGGDSTYVKDKGLYIRNDAGPTHVNKTGVDNFTLRIHNGAYAGSGISDPQGSIAKILFHGVTHNGWNSYASILMDVQGTSGGRGDLVFLTGGDTTQTRERLRINRGGSSQFVANNNVDVIYSSCAASGTTATVFRGSQNATVGDPDSGTDSIYIFANGNIQNTNNSYGQISDIKLKENIVDAGSQWDDFKAVRFRKYNFKAETGHETHTQLGVIAQELELTSPGLVYEVAEKDEDGNPTGESTKAVMSSVLTNKALVALQEAMARIETLEAKVAALEGS